MIYIYGLMLSVLCGLSNSVTKILATKMQTKYCVLISSWFNLIGSALVYFLLFNQNLSQFLVILKLGLIPIFVLILYLIFRIFSNVAQTKLFSRKNININILNIVLSCMFFVTIAIDAIFGTSYGIMTILGFLLSLFGILITVVDFKNLKFYFSKDELFLLLVAFVCAGTKPVMAKFLLHYIPIELLAIIECLNYAIVYSCYNYKNLFKIPGINKYIIKKFLIQSAIGVCCVFIQYKAMADVKIYILTSFATPIFTAIFAYLIHREILNKKSVIGIIVILLGICVSKLSM